MPQALQNPLWYRVAALRPRLRPDVRMTRQHFRGALWYLAEDAAHNRFHRLPPAAHAAVALMDGTRTVEEIWNHLADLGEERPGQAELIELLVQLDAADLLATDARPDFAQLSQRARKQNRQKLVRRWISPLYLRIPLVDPDRFLNALLPLARPLWSVWGLALWLAVVGWGVVHAALDWSALTRDITDRVLAGDNLLILFLTFPLVKVLHELGHGIFAKLGGGEVHEAGVMTLVFLPVPYVDVTSATVLDSRWHRALVGAAGMMVEVFLASLAMMVWSAVEPGILRAAMFNVMVIAGVSTLVFNGNPLLRFDAYYILSDLIEIPNLATRSARFYGYLVTRYLFRIKHQISPAYARGEAVWFAFYAPASYLYRLFVMISIALFVAGAFHGLGAVLALWTLGVGVVLPLLRGVWYLGASPTLQRHRIRAFAVTAAMAGAAAALVFAVPFPYGTIAEGVVWTPPEAELRPAAEGTVEAVNAARDSVLAPGTPVVTLSDPLLVARVRVLEAELAEVRLRLFAAENRSQVQAEIFRQQETYFASELADAQRRRDGLVLRSPGSGRLILGVPQDLPGHYVRRGELLGYVVDGRAAAIRVVVPQSEIDLVRGETRPVTIRFASHALTEYRSPAVLREVPTATRELPSAALSVPGGGTVSVDPEDEKHLRAVSTFFQLDVALPAKMSVARIGERVYVRFDHGTRTIGWRVGRDLSQLFLQRLEL